MQTNKTRGQSFLHGALILTAGMMLVKVIGALFKIPLKYSIGEYGMGLFNVAYNFYGPVFSLCTAGFPVAVSRLVSESRSLGRWNDVRAVKKAAAPLFLAFGGAGMALLTLLAPLYCKYVIHEPNALAPVLALAPAILFACLGSVYRGYYEGLQNMTPTALSEVAEALVKLVLGLALSRWAIEFFTGRFGAADDSLKLRALSFAAAGAVLGVTAGSAAALLYLALRFRRRGGGIDPQLYKVSPPAMGRKTAVRRLLAITLPIAAGSITTNVAGLIDATFLQNRISGLLHTRPEALLSRFPGMIPEMYLENPQSIPTFLYGCYTLAMTVYLLVPSLTQAFGISALPTVTAAWARKDKEKLNARLSSVCRVTALFCFPAGLGVSALSGPIVRVLYGDDPSAPIVSGVLFLLGIASLWAAMCAPLSSLLQAVDRADLPVKLLCAAMTVKLLVNWFLCGQPEWNIYGAAVGTFLCYLFLAVSQFLCLRRVAGADLRPAALFLKPLLCAALCGLSAWGCFRGSALLAPQLGEAVRLGLSVALGGLFYVISLLLLGGVEKEDLKMLPQGQKITKTLEKWGWM